MSDPTKMDINQALFLLGKLEATVKYTKPNVKSLLGHNKKHLMAHIRDVYGRYFMLEYVQYPDVPNKTLYLPIELKVHDYLILIYEELLSELRIERTKIHKELHN